MNRKIIRGCHTVIFIEINDVTILIGRFLIEWIRKGGFIKGLS